MKTEYHLALLLTYEASLSFSQTHSFSCTHTFVVYFDQQTGGQHAIHCQNQLFLRQPAFKSNT